MYGRGRFLACTHRWGLQSFTWYLVIYLVWPHQCWRSTCVAVGLGGLQSSKKHIRDCLSRCRPFLKAFTVLAFNVRWSRLFRLLTSRSAKKVPSHFQFGSVLHCRDQHWTDNQNFFVNTWKLYFFLFHEASARLWQFDFYAPFTNCSYLLSTRSYTVEIVQSNHRVIVFAEGNCSVVLFSSKIAMLRRLMSPL